MSFSQPRPRLLLLCPLALSSLVFLDSASVLPAAPPSLPKINTNNVINITTSPYNAIGDGVTTNTVAIQNAINAAAAGLATNGLTGGTVEIPPGVFLCGPLTMKSAVNLQIDSGATLKMLPYASWPGTTTFISGNRLHDVEISGAGTIDGQGAPWWAAFNSSGISRPNFIQFSTTTNILIQDVLLQNPPTFHLMLKNNNVNLTIRRITINTPGTSPNTDGMDLASANVLVQDSYISAGDDNIEIGGSQPAVGIVVTNCTFGTGHGISIGSITSGGVSNLTVVDCSFNGTDYGIRMKSDNNPSGSGAGGLVQNLSYSNIGMTNIVRAAIVIYSYYSSYGTPTSITPAIAAGQPIEPVTSNTVVWRNITISNVTAAVASTAIGGIIWGRIELPVTNVVLADVSITGPKTFDVYNAFGVQFLDSQIGFTSGSALTLFNTQITISNSNPFGASPYSLDGLTTNGLGNALCIFNGQVSLKNTNLLSSTPILTLGAATLSITNDLNLLAPTVLNLFLGTNSNQIVISGKLGVSGIVNVGDAGGFGPGSYTLFSYGGSLNWQSPVIGTAPTNFTYSFDTNTAGQVKLLVVSSGPLPPAAPNNVVALAGDGSVQLSWSPSDTATNYNVWRALTSDGPYSFIAATGLGTSYTDNAVTNGVLYFYAVSAVNGAGEGPSSVVAQAQPLSSTPPTLLFQTSGDELQVSWPTDNLGWLLAIQTNSPFAGLGTNWSFISNSVETETMSIPIDPANGSVFLRLVHP